MNILVVGGAGNLGRAFVEGLKLKSHRAFVWDKKEGLLNLFVDTLVNWQIDLIVNFSVIANLRQKEVRVTDEDYSVNVLGLSHLVDLSQEVKIPIIHISTREVIGVRDFRLNNTIVDNSVSLRQISEDEPCLPLHSYGKTKLISEFIMHGCTLGTTIRLNTCYTDEIIGGAGLIANLIRKSRDESRVVLDNNGVALRDPLHISDLLDLILRVHNARFYGETLHAGGGTDNIISLKDICFLANKDVVVTNGKTNNDFGFLMNITKAQTLGWIPSINFREWISRIS